MKATGRLFSIGIRQIAKDGMLFIMLPAPFFVGIILKIGLPFINRMAISNQSFSNVPWYGLADGLLASLTPVFVAIVAGFLILDERDQGITEFYQITPISGNSFLLARLGIPLIWGLFSTTLSLYLFSLTNLSFADIVVLSLIGTFTGCALAMLMVSIAENRVEGLVVSKLMGISFLGLVFVWFVPVPYKYIAAILPSYWVGSIVQSGVNLVSFLIAMLVCIVWTVFFTQKFLKRIR